MRSANASKIRPFPTFLDVLIFQPFSIPDMAAPPPSLPRLLLCLAALLPGACAAPPRVPWREPSTMDTAMRLYRPGNTMTQFVPSARRHREIAPLLSRRVNALYARWDALDDRLQPLLRRVERRDPHHPFSTTLNWWGHFTAPLPGCRDFLEDLRFQKIPGTDQIRITARGTGPMGSSTTRETLTLTFTSEGGRHVLDGVTREAITRGSGKPQVEKETLESYITGNIRTWEDWIHQAEDRLRGPKAGR